MCSGNVFSLCLILQIINSLASAASDKPLAKTPWGLVHGKYLKVNESHQVACFLGLPYTLPPVGPLRFTRTYPVAHNHHHDHHKATIIKADSFKPACIQSPFFYQAHAGNVTLSENCLYLNIFTPVSGNELTFTKLYPVFVYVHGSAFAFGGPAGIHNQAQYLAAFGDIMVVTMAHRLGFLGRPYDGPVEVAEQNYPHHLPGNQDLHDVIQSLQWVHNNIRYFGGDPDRVTLGGLSAGSIVATSLFVSPIVPDGLFNKVVAMSGLPISPPTTINPTRAKSITKEISSAVKCSFSDTDTKDRPLNWYEIHCLKRVDPFDLVKASASISFSPMYGDDILPQQPQELIKSPIFKKNRYSLLIGTEQNEDVVSHSTPTTVNDAITDLSNLFQDRFGVEKMDNFTAIIQSYFNELQEDQLTNQTAVESIFHAIISDFTFICPSLLMGKIFSLNNQVYFYRNEVVLDADKDRRPFGTLHADDSALFIGYPFTTPDLYSDSDRATSLQMMKLLGTFVKDGYAPWPAVRDQDGKITPYVWKITKELDYQNFEVDPYNKRCSEWAQIYQIDDI